MVPRVRCQMASWRMLSTAKEFSNDQKKSFPPKETITVLVVQQLFIRTQHISQIISQNFSPESTKPHRSSSSSLPLPLVIEALRSRHVRDNQ